MRTPRVIAASIVVMAFAWLSFAAVRYCNEAEQLGRIIFAKLSSSSRAPTSNERDEPEAAAQDRLRLGFFAANIDYPPAAATLVLNRGTSTLELYARSHDESWRFVRAYRLPERSQIEVADGLYRVNAIDAHRGLALEDVDGGVETQASTILVTLGTAFKAHTASATLESHEPIEDLCALAAAIGIENLRLLVTPRDFRITEDAQLAARPDEKSAPYERIREELALLKVRHRRPWL